MGYLFWLLAPAALVMVLAVIVMFSGRFIEAMIDILRGVFDES